MSSPQRFSRCLLSTFGGFCFAMFVASAVKTWQEIGIQGWEPLGYNWLGLDFWANASETKIATAGAALTLALALLGEMLHKNQFVGLKLIRWGSQFASKIWVLAILAFLAFPMPVLLAKMTQPDAPDEAPNVLYVMVDTWRADHVGWLGYERDVTPGLDELVKSGVVFENAVSATSWTRPSVGTQFTGLMPSQHGAVSQTLNGIDAHGTQLTPFLLTWMEVLRAQGWDTGMWSNNPNIRPAHGFGQGVNYFMNYYGHPDRILSGPGVEGYDPGRSERMLPEVREWIDETWDRSRPFAAYLHIMDPHYPYVAPAPFKGKFDKTGSDFQLEGTICGDYIAGKSNIDEVTDLELERIKAIYDEEILYVDHHLTPFLKGVMEEFPNTVIILVSDHGEEFMEHGLFGHGHSIYNEVVKVPLVVWAPELEPNRVPWQVHLLDIFPTIVDLSGAKPNAGIENLDGKSLALSIEAHRLAPTEAGGDERPPWHWRGLSDGEWKTIERLEVNPADHEIWKNGIPVLDKVREEEGMPYFEVYNLQQDPGEQSDLVKTEIERARAMKKVLEDKGWYYSADWVNQFGTSREQGGNLALLEQLGYLNSDDSH